MLDLLVQMENMSMIQEATVDRILAMTAQERRWLDNVKKAFFDSDLAASQGRHADHCLPELCKAVDVAKTLRRSLLGQDVSGADNKRRFQEFIDLEVPTPSRGGLAIELVDAKMGMPQVFSFSAIVYCVRCAALHENENLNAADQPDFHVKIAWEGMKENYCGFVLDGRLTCNGWAMWNRLRQVVAKFITGIEGIEAFHQGRPFSFHVQPPMGAIRPGASSQPE